MNDEWESRIAETAALLRHAVGNGWISGDGRVSTETAAALLDVEPTTLEKWRTDRKGPAYFRSGGRGCRVTYRLRDLAEFIEVRRVG
jgi:hypothetical protein